MFRKVLIANRGEIARRIIRTCRAMGIGTVAIYADPDREAPFVREADEAVGIGAPQAAGTFLASEKIVSIAKARGADAIHPGYGFLAENAGFAAACAAAGIVFVGPRPETIRQLGDKSAAKEAANAAGVPVIPGFSAVGLDPSMVAARCATLGYPIMLKAAAGGGGRGMRAVTDERELSRSLAAASAEAMAAFGDGALLVERLYPQARHVEVQILGDQHGKVVHLFERECSIQRRHQKLIEETPAPGLSAPLREKLCAWAVNLASAVGYQNAGTVEFLWVGDDEAYFLEVNTRLQVEHPVTEETLGLDLVRLQLELAAGQPLELDQQALRPLGHAIEARVCAEDPRAGYLPSTGTVHAWEPTLLEGVRYESGVETDSRVTPHYDPLLAKVIAHGDDRDEAIARLAQALRRLFVAGVTTNRELLVVALADPTFVAGTHHTRTIDEQGLLARLAPDPTLAERHAVAAALWLQSRRRATAPVLATIPSGFRNNRSQLQRQGFGVGETRLTVDYAVSSKSAVGTVSGRPFSANLHAADANGIVLELDQMRQAFRIVRSEERLWVHSTLGTSGLDLAPRFPEAATDQVAGGCRAPVPGRVLAVQVSVGQRVERGQRLLSIEAMKMEHQLNAPHDGLVREIHAVVGQQVEAGALLLLLDNESPPVTP